MSKKGRPPLLSSDGRNERINLRATEDQKKLLSELSETRNQTITELIFAGLALLLIYEASKEG